MDNVNGIALTAKHFALSVLFLNFTHLKKLPVVHYLIHYCNMSCIKSFLLKKVKMHSGQM